MSYRSDKTTSGIVFEAIGGIVTLMAVGFLANLAGALWLMLGLGAAHAQWDAVPAPGYWTTFVMLMGLFAVAGVFRARTKTEGSK